jgi:tetratricopeptide (TPR) repeat protein
VPAELRCASISGIALVSSSVSAGFLAGCEVTTRIRLIHVAQVTVGESEPKSFKFGSLACDREEEADRSAATRWWSKTASKTLHFSLPTGDTGCAFDSQRKRIGVVKSVRHMLRWSRTIGLVLFILSWSLPSQPQNDPGQAAIELEQQGKTAEAEAAWRALAKAHPTDPEPLAHLGLVEARQEHYAEAIASYRKAMALNPTMPRLGFNLGLAYFKAGEYREAIQQFKPLLKSEPPDSEEAQRLVILIGMSHYGLAEFHAATPFLKQAADRDPKNLPLLLTLAHSCLLSQQYPCVLDAFHQIMSLNAESAEAHMLMGEALDEMKDTNGAIRELRAAVQVNPKEPNVHFALGYLLWTQGHTEEAAHEFQTELKNIPGHNQATLYLADSYIQMNRFEDATPLLEATVKTNPTSSMGHLDLGIVCAEAGRKEQALAQFKTAITLKPDDVNAHWRLGRLYRSMGKTAEAKVEFDKSRTLNKTADERLLKVMSQVPVEGNAGQGTTAAPAVK